MSEKRIAVRYAKSLVDLAAEMKVLDSVKKDMELIDGVCEENRQLRLMLKSPIILSDKKRNILELIFDKKVSELTLKFFKVLSRKNRLNVLPYITGEVIQQYNKINGIQTATITSSMPLTPKMRTEVEKIVAKASGKKVLLEEKIDKELIGGFVLNIGDRQLDESIAGNLNRLRIKLLE
jgi:F-type H+-transporting ATPase subunit delta